MKVQFAQKAIITNGNKVLLIQKGPEDPYHPLKWEIPGGRLEESETIDEHIKREVKEEVGLDIDPHKPLAIWSWQLGYGPTAPTVVAVARHCSRRSADSISLDGLKGGLHPVMEVGPDVRSFGIRSDPERSGAYSLLDP